MGLSFWRSKDFKRYFFVYLIVFLVSIGVGAVAVALAARGESSRAAAQQRESQSRKITETLDNTWSAVIDTGKYLQNSTWVQKYMALSGAFSSDFDLLRKAEYSNLLNALCASNQGIRDVSILYPQKDTVVTTAGWRDFSGLEYYMANTMHLPAEAYETLCRRLEEEKSPSYIAYVGERYLLYVCSLDILQQPRAVAVICMDKNAVIRLLSVLCGESVAGVRVSGVEGEPEEVYLEYGGAENRKDLLAWETTSQNMLMKYTIFHYDQTPPLFDSVWYPLVILGLVAGGVVLAYMLASFQYFPLNRLISKINAKSKGASAGGMYTIQAAVDKLYEYNINLEHTLSSYQQVLREQTNSHLLKGNFFDELQSSPRLCNGYWYVVLLFPKAGGESQVVQALRAALQSVSGGQSHSEMVEDIEGNIAVIVEFSQKPQEDALLLWGKALRDKAALCGERDIALVLSRPRKGLRAVSTAYQETKEAWQEGGGTSVEMAKLSMRYYYPLDWENQLVRAMQEGNRAVTQAILQQLYTENQTLNLSATLVERLGMLLYEVIRRFVIEEKLPVQAFFEIEEPQYGMSLEEVFQNAETAAEHICQMRTAIKQDTGHSVSSALIDYVNANVYDPDLSLGALGEMFGLSNASISRIFKNTAGINFHKYVTEKRMRRAQELLRFKGYRPKEIASEVGYDKEYSFKRAFTQQYGFGPKEYVESLEQKSESTV